MSHVDELLAGSSLGTPDAEHLVAHADPARIERVLRRSRSRLSVVPTVAPSPGRRTLWIGLGVAAAIALLAGVLVLGLAVLGIHRPGSGPAQQATVPGFATPSPVPSPTPSPSPTPTRTVRPPTGFVSCTVLGTRGFCPTTPECWDGYSQVYDLPAVSNKVSCQRRHLYQTFIAGDVGGGARSQSGLEKSVLARKLCTASTLEAVLGRGAVPGDWQIQKLPAPLKVAGDQAFRCIVFTGEFRKTPLKLTYPG